MQTVRSKLLFTAVAAALIAGTAATYAHDTHSRGRARDVADDSRAWLGVMLTGDDGARVLSVVDDSPAAVAGIEDGDRIVAIDGDEVRSYRRLVRRLRDRESGDTVTVTVRRDGEELDLGVTLGAWPDEPMVAFGEHDWEAFGKKMEKLGKRFEKLGEKFEDMEFGKGKARAYAFSFGGPSVRMGVKVQDLSDGLREYFRAPVDRGVLISDVIDDSPAAAAGLRAGDLILSVDGHDVGSPGEIRRALGEREAGDRVPVLVLRDGAETSFDVTVEKAPGRHRSFHFKCCSDDGCDDDDCGSCEGWNSLTPDKRGELEELLESLPERLAFVPDIVRDALGNTRIEIRGLGDLHKLHDLHDLHQLRDLDFDFDFDFDFGEGGRQIEIGSEQY